MKVVAINGSPNPDGNTSIMLNKVLEEVAKEGIETKLIQIGGKTIQGCRGCRACFVKKDQKCIFNNDIFNEVFSEAAQADAIILGSPTYFADMTAELKAFIDRAGYVALANDRMFRRKVGAAVAVNRRGGAVGVQASINHVFLINEMIVPGSTYWNIGVGLQKGDVAADDEAMANMANLGQNIAWLLKKLNN